MRDKEKRKAYQKEYQKNYQRDKEKAKAYNKEYSRKNRKRLNEYNKEYRKNNPEQDAVSQAKSYQKNKENQRAGREEYQKNYRKENKEKVSASRKKYAQKNKDKYAEYRRERAGNDPEFRLKSNLRSRLWKAVRDGIGKKSGSTLELTGCSWEELRSHLESQFTEGMTWENYGEWHVDHIRPCASFDLTIDKEQEICFNYTNLQPLWAAENISKSDKY